MNNFKVRINVDFAFNKLHCSEALKLPLRLRTITQYGVRRGEQAS